MLFISCTSLFLLGLPALPNAVAFPAFSAPPNATSTKPSASLESVITGATSLSSFVTSNALSWTMFMIEGIEKLTTAYPQGRLFTLENSVKPGQQARTPDDLTRYRIILGDEGGYGDEVFLVNTEGKAWGEPELQDTRWPGLMIRLDWPLPFDIYRADEISKAQGKPPFTLPYTRIRAAANGYFFDQGEGAQQKASWIVWYDGEVDILSGTSLLSIANGTAATS